MPIRVNLRKVSTYLHLCMDKTMSIINYMPIRVAEW